MESLSEKIIKRYEKESEKDCQLGCGTNLIYLELKPGEKVLDLGCGKGNETIRAAKKVGDQGMAVGLDITDKMLEAARLNAKDQNVENIDFIAGDIEKMSFLNNSFDAVLSNCVINHAKNKKLVYKEIHRVLKNSGRFVVSDAVTKFPLPGNIKNDPDAWAQCFGGAITEDEYLQSILDAGFSKFEIINRREYLKNGFDFISLTIRANK